jgi:hypothetical protein
MDPRDPSWWHKPWPLGVRLFGVLYLILALIGAITGKAYGRGGTVEYDKEPMVYGLTLVIEVLGGVFLIWYSLYVMPH